MAEEDEMKGVILVDLFGGISGARVAAEAVGLEVLSHLYIEADDMAAKVVEKTWGECEVQPVRMKDVLDFGAAEARYIWLAAKHFNAKTVLVTAGFPCKDLSALNADGQGLHGKSSGLFFQLLRVLEALRAQKPEDCHIDMHFVVENVLSMEASWRKRISLGLGVEPVLLDPRNMGWRKRPRLHWASFELKARDGERWYELQGVRGLDVKLAKPPLEELLDQSD